jgi:16S rRNA (cytidine1402-2'-O)-methyltransferase
MSGILYVVATPIGNLEDVTLRALRVLREVSLIAAEDTRRTARLLQHYSIPTPTTSLHAHNERARTAAVLARLKQGDSVALVSDAGTPVVSDPGALLVAAALDAGIKVEPIPGPSAVPALLSAAGVVSEGFVFVGFAPARSSDRKRWLRELAIERRAIVLFEAPHRIRALLEDMAAILGERRLTIGREMTKAHEQFLAGHASDVLAQLQQTRGELSLVIHPQRAAGEETRAVPDNAVLAREFGELTNAGGLGRRQALRQLAEKYDIPARAVYRAVEEGKI